MKITILKYRYLCSNYKRDTLIKTKTFCMYVTLHTLLVS